LDLLFLHSCLLLPDSICFTDQGKFVHRFSTALVVVFFRIHKKLQKCETVVTDFALTTGQHRRFGNYSSIRWY